MTTMNGYKTPYEKSIGMVPVWPQPRTTPRQMLGNELADRSFAMEKGLSVEATDIIIEWHLRGLGGLGAVW